MELNSEVSEWTTQISKRSCITISDLGAFCVFRIKIKIGCFFFFLFLSLPRREKQSDKWLIHRTTDYVVLGQFWGQCWLCFVCVWLGTPRYQCGWRRTQMLKVHAHIVFVIALLRISFQCLQVCFTFSWITVNFLFLFLVILVKIRGIMVRGTFVLFLFLDYLLKCFNLMKLSFFHLRSFHIGWEVPRIEDFGHTISSFSTRDSLEV